MGVAGDAFLVSQLSEGETWPGGAAAQGTQILPVLVEQEEIKGQVRRKEQKKDLRRKRKKEEP